MQCSETDSKLPAVKIPMSITLLKDLSYWVNAIKEVGGNGRVTFFVNGGKVSDEYEISIKPPRKKAS